MTKNEAVQLAKAYVADVYADEQPVNVGLEELEFDDDRNAWLVTVGFSRPWDRVEAGAALTRGGALRRAFKRLIVSNDGTVRALRNHPVENWINEPVEA